MKAIEPYFLVVLSQFNYAVQGGFKFESGTEWNPKVWPFK